MLIFWVKHTFIRDGTALAYYSLDSSLRIWDVADLTAESRHSTDGYEHIVTILTQTSQCIVDG